MSLTNRLLADIWTQWVPAEQDQKRLQLAASAPFHSIHAASHDNGSTVINAIQFALLRISDFSVSVLDPSPGGSAWGPFSIDEGEGGSLRFGTTTMNAVKLFQQQAQSTPDGKVGMDTFQWMDLLLIRLESMPSPASNNESSESN
jgi:Putative peptidoglycan binding domain